MQDDMDPPLHVLFMVHCEYGQANVVLAVAQSLARDSHFDISIASFAKLGPRIDAINEGNKDLARPLTFRSIPGIAMEDLAARQNHKNPESPYAHPPGFFNAISSYSNLDGAAFGWRPSEYMDIMQHCRTIILETSPAALVCDLGFFHAHDAARGLGLDYITISPSSAKEFLAGVLPGAPLFWKWPAMASGFQYPLSLLNMLKNIVVAICFIYTLMRGPHLRAMIKARKEAGLKYTFPLLVPYRKEDKYISPFTPEADFSGLDDIPSNVLISGPITLPPIRALAEADADLMHWLARRPTVLVNLGTHFAADRDASLELAKGIKTVLEARDDVQVLWKLKYDWSGDVQIKGLVETFVRMDRLRIVPWLHSEPSSLLETGHFVCAVHHGGANSYYEACRAGVPQLVLPVWWDTYEYAERARWLGIGLIGNVGVAPGVEGTQFGTKLLQILDSANIQERAAEVLAACRRRGEGRDLAAAEVADWARSGKTRVVDGK